MDNHHIHINFHADDLAVPEVVVDEEETEDLAEKPETLPDEKDKPEAASEKDAVKKTEDKTEDPSDAKKNHKKITPHVQYDTLAVPEITFDIEED